MRDSFEHIDQFRVPEGPLASTPGDGRHGAFIIPITGHRQETVLIIIATDGTEMTGDPCTRWEHVSVHVAVDTGKNGVKKRTPTWGEMALTKGVFWGPEEAVMQLHPRESQYVNNHEHVLHLWKPLDYEIPEPDPMLVGILDRMQGSPEDPQPEDQSEETPPAPPEEEGEVVELVEDGKIVEMRHPDHPGARPSRVLKLDDLPPRDE
jgi:hypothetical protein